MKNFPKNVPSAFTQSIKRQIYTDQDYCLTRRKILKPRKFPLYHQHNLYPRLTNSFLPFRTADEETKRLLVQFRTAQLVSEGFVGLALSAQTSSPETRSKRVQFASSRLAINAGRIVNQMSWHARVEEGGHARDNVYHVGEGETNWFIGQATYPTTAVNQVRNKWNAPRFLGGTRIQVTCSHVLTFLGSVLKPAKI